MPEPYGCKGCRCWARGAVDDGGWVDGEPDWQPNANCPHHGVLAPYTAPRRDTGTYRVVGTDPPLDEWWDSLSRRLEKATTYEDGPECPPGLHSMFDPCGGGCLNEEATAMDDAPTVADWVEMQGIGTQGLTQAQIDAIAKSLAGIQAKQANETDFDYIPTEGEVYAARKRAACHRECRGDANCPGRVNGRCMAPTTEKERGVLATVRRWFRDWFWAGIWRR